MENNYPMIEWHYNVSAMDNAVNVNISFSEEQLMQILPPELREKAKLFAPTRDEAKRIFNEMWKNGDVFKYASDVLDFSLKSWGSYQSYRLSLKPMCWMEE